MGWRLSGLESEGEQNTPPPLRPLWCKDLEPKAAEKMQEELSVLLLFAQNQDINL